MDENTGLCHSSATKRNIKQLIEVLLPPPHLKIRVLLFNISIYMSGPHCSYIFYTDEIVVKKLRIDYRSSMLLLLSSLLHDRQLVV